MKNLLPTVSLLCGSALNQQLDTFFIIIRTTQSKFSALWFVNHLPQYPHFFFVWLIEKLDKVATTKSFDCVNPNCLLWAQKLLKRNFLVTFQHPHVCYNLLWKAAANQISSTDAEGTFSTSIYQWNCKIFIVEITNKKKNSQDFCTIT